MGGFATRARVTRACVTCGGRRRFAADDVLDMPLAAVWRCLRVEPASDPLAVRFRVVGETKAHQALEYAVVECVQGAAAKVAKVGVVITDAEVAAARGEPQLVRGAVVGMPIKPSHLLGQWSGGNVIADGFFEITHHVVLTRPVCASIVIRLEPACHFCELKPLFGSRGTL